MTRFLLFIFAIFTLTQAAVAEPKDEPNAEKLKELQEFKVKYLCQEMDLPADKQAEFSKLYMQYENERSTLFRELHKNFKHLSKSQSHTDVDYANAAEKMASAKSREGDLEMKYFNIFKTMLTPKQLYLMKRAEDKFDRKLGEMHRKNNGNKQKK